MQCLTICKNAQIHECYWQVENALGQTDTNKDRQYLSVVMVQYMILFLYIYNFFQKGM